MEGYLRRKKLLLKLLGSAACFLCVGCHSPAPDSGFIRQPNLLHEDKQFPLDAIWSKNDLDLSKFKKVYISDVDTSHLLKMSWWDKLSVANLTEKFQPKNEASLLAAYFKDTLVSEFKRTKENRLIVVDKPDDETLIVELALTEVVPTKVWLNSLSYVIAGAFDTGATAIEGRLKNSRSQEVIFRFKDKRAGPYSIVNAKDFTWYSHSKYTIDGWSHVIVKLCNASKGEVIPAPSSFTLKPW